MSVKRRVRLGTPKLRTVKENIVNGEQGLVQNKRKATVDFWLLMGESVVVQLSLQLSFLLNSAQNSESTSEHGHVHLPNHVNATGFDPGLILVLTINVVLNLRFLLNPLSVDVGLNGTPGHVIMILNLQLHLPSFVMLQRSLSGKSGYLGAHATFTLARDPDAESAHAKTI